tara:strand:+ start:2189 stop:2785 length:597 start_codon:yes stop_codon:yes gene_type:complete
MDIKFYNMKLVFGGYAKDALKRARVSLKIKGFSGKKNKTDNTGALSDGLGYDVIEENNGLILQFTSKEIYGAFIEEGVNGTKINHGSKYGFKGKNVNQEAIIKWLKSPKIRLREIKGPNQGRFVEKSERNIKQAAFMIGRSMALKGIKGIGYMAKSNIYAFEDNKEEITRAFTEDVADAMVKQLTANLPKGTTTIKRN